jgi:hypothetical protein
MIVPIPFNEPDERFLMHRLRSTSIAGVLGGFLAVALWAYQYHANDVWRWDLFAVAATMAVVKLAAMAFFRLVD